MTDVNIRNVLTSNSSPRVSPFEMLFKRKPRLKSLRMFGSLCYAHIDKTKRKNLMTQDCAASF